MNLTQSYDPHFTALMQNLKDTLPARLFDLEGIGKQLDMCAFSKDFFSATTTADASVDANANVSDTSNVTYTVELPKPFFKLNSIYMLWKAARKLYGTEVADEIVTSELSGDIYINDLHGIGAGSAYCYNYSTYDIMLNGLTMVDKIKSYPPKYLYSFKSQLEQFVVVASNSTLGATGLADLLIVMSLYLRRILRDRSDAGFSFADEASCWRYVKENMVSFIYTLGQPMRGNQSPFTNVSLYDEVFLDSLCGSYLDPQTGEPADKELVKQLQVIFIDTMNEEMRRTPVTFPVTTACFAIDDEKNLLDPAFVALIAEKNLEFGFINIYCGKSSTLSSCCFTGETEVLVMDSTNGVSRVSLRDYAALPWESKKNTTVYHDGSWVRAKTVAVPPTTPLYEVLTAHNKKMLVTGDHLFPTLDGDKRADELTLEDYLLVSTSPLDAPTTRRDASLTYEDGLLVGAYLGDGTIYWRKTSDAVEVTLSINQQKAQALKNILTQWASYGEKHNVIQYKVYAKSVAEFLERWTVAGKDASEKRLKMDVLEQPLEFRNGILRGMYITDGGNSNRIYTTSAGLAGDLEALLTSLGKASIIDVSDRTDEPVLIRGEEFQRNYPLHCVRWYDRRGKRSMAGVYVQRNGNLYFKVKSVTETSIQEDKVFCFEVHNDAEPYFTLPSGVVSHNCRLRSETDNEYFNSFGSGSTKIGSQGVCTINLPRAATKMAGQSEGVQAHAEDSFMDEVKRLVGLAQRVNHTKRTLIKKRIENGNLPLYTLGFMNLSTQYSTLGVNGLNESCEILGYDILTEAGQQFVLRLLTVINAENERYQKQYKAPHNCEQIPGENVSIKLAEKDRLLGYNEHYPLYSNQFIPLTVQADMLDRIHLQGLFDSHFSGGAICHINVEQRIEEAQKLVDLITYCAKEGVVYFAINYNIQRCSEGHMSVGTKEVCGVCGAEVVENFTRVVGFLSAVKNWSKTRRSIDYPNRQFYPEVAA